ncbi:hypothetical protein ACIP88_10530 [Streptomyces uncialis]|uniref:hypothetical protein n=1 Tax=Streptomyces uncialis TaxID=1048205 RepID=UPI0037FDACCE
MHISFLTQHAHSTARTLRTTRTAHVRRAVPGRAAPHRARRTGSVPPTARDTGGAVVPRAVDREARPA